MQVHLQNYLFWSNFVYIFVKKGKKIHFLLYHCIEKIKSTVSSPFESSIDTGHFNEEANHYTAWRVLFI